MPQLSGGHQQPANTSFSMYSTIRRIRILLYQPPLSGTIHKQAACSHVVGTSNQQLSLDKPAQEVPPSRTDRDIEPELPQHQATVDLTDRGCLSLPNHEASFLGRGQCSGKIEGEKPSIVSWSVSSHGRRLLP